jgi:hypothetical protein
MVVEESSSGNRPGSFQIPMVTLDNLYRIYPVNGVVRAPKTHRTGPMRRTSRSLIGAFSGLTPSIFKSDGLISFAQLQERLGAEARACMVPGTTKYRRVKLVFLSNQPGLAAADMQPKT